MGFFRTKKRHSHGVSSREEKLLSQISELEEFIEGAPDRIRKEMQEQITTMPPPDDLQDRRRERKFYTQLSKGEIRNEHRYQTRSAFLFVLLVAAILSLSAWICSVLQAV